MKNLQQVPDFCYSVAEGKSHHRVSNNDRYRYFHQTHYTAGDPEQFLEEIKNLKDHPSRNTTIVQKYGNHTMFQNLSLPVEEYCILDVYNTFSYIFDKFKKGSFLQIYDNEIKTFIPFSKQNFRNEWGNYLKIDPKFGNDICDLMKVLSTYDRSALPFEIGRAHV